MVEQVRAPDDAPVHVAPADDAPTDDAPPKDSSTKVSLWTRVSSRIVIQFLCHKWAAVTGEHADFATATELGSRLQHSFSETVPMSTLCWWLKAEKKAYLSWKNNELKVGELKPITSKGDGLLPLLAKALEMEKAESLIDAKLCKEREQGNKVFTQEMRALLKLECTALKDCPGFCTASIAMIASDVYERTVGEHMQISWVPSPGSPSSLCCSG